MGAARNDEDVRRAGGSSGLGSAAGSILSSPIVQAILGSIGGNILGSLFGDSGTGFEEATAQRLGIGQTLIPQLQQEAAGLPSIATQAQQAQAGAAINRLQQSFAASATRAGMGGPVGRGGLPTATRAQQGRLQAAGLSAKLQIAGQGQRFAQQQLAQLYGGAAPFAERIDIQRRQAMRQGLSDIGSIIGQYRADRDAGSVDSRYQELIDMLFSTISNQQGLLQTK